MQTTLQEYRSARQNRTLPVVDLSQINSTLYVNIDPLRLLKGLGHQKDREKKSLKILRCLNTCTMNI